MVSDVQAQLPRPRPNDGGTWHHSVPYDYCRWVQQYVPEFEKRWNHYARPVGDSWRVDETYIKVKGQWVYLYRAVDKQGRTVDFLLSKRRDVAAAKRFFSRAAKQHGAPRVITLDGYSASHRAVAKLKEVGTLPRQRVRPMLGFKRCETAAVMIRGIELAAKIKKDQFNLRPLTGKPATAPEMTHNVRRHVLLGQPYPGGGTESRYR